VAASVCAAAVGGAAGGAGGGACDGAAGPDGSGQASALCSVAAYALGLWPRPVGFVDHGELELSTNLSENALRGVALGRKNWIHVGSAEAGPKVAAILSVVETSKRLGLDLRAYLAEVLPRLADTNIQRLGELTPSRWAASRGG